MRFSMLLVLASSILICSDSRAALPTSSTTPGLADLEARAPKSDTDHAAVDQFLADVCHLVESGQLKTGDEFFRASNLLQLGGNEYRTARVQYELLLAAVASGNRNAELLLPMAWDGVLHTLGRPMRFDVGGFSTKYPDYFTLEAAPKVIQDVWRNPATARAAVKAAKHHNAEMQTILDADQAARDRDWSKFTPAELKDLEDGDRKRNARTREIVSAGDLHTDRDFANAALVMQHSPNFAGYELAHELAVCSMLLGDHSFGRQTVTASYDRMLHSVGHDQRFATQISNGRIEHTDTSGICDAERIALDCQSFDRKPSSRP
jgi:hypothetical protein